MKNIVKICAWFGYGFSLNKNNSKSEKGAKKLKNTAVLVIESSAFS